MAREEITFHPTGRVERIADAALEAAKVAAEAEGLTLGETLLLLRADGTEGDEVDAVTTGHFTTDEPPDMKFVLVELLTRAHTIARMMGLNLEYTGLPSAYRPRGPRRPPLRRQGGRPRGR